EPVSRMFDLVQPFIARRRHHGDAREAWVDELGRRACRQHMSTRRPMRERFESSNSPCEGIYNVKPAVCPACVEPKAKATLSTLFTRNESSAGACHYCNSLKNFYLLHIVDLFRGRMFSALNGPDASS